MWCRPRTINMESDTNEIIGKFATDYAKATLLP